MVKDVEAIVCAYICIYIFKNFEGFSYSIFWSYTFPFPTPPPNFMFFLTFKNNAPQNKQKNENQNKKTNIKK